MVFCNLDTFFSYKNSIYFKHDKINTSLTEATHIHQYLRHKQETAYSLSHTSQISMGKKICNRSLQFCTGVIDNQVSLSEVYRCFKTQYS